MLVVLPQDSDMAIPAKVFDYMRYDAWLLALADHGSAVEQLLRASQADVVAPDALETLSALLQVRYIQHLRNLHRTTGVAAAHRLHCAGERRSRRRNRR